jgi:hypothetical protein
VLEPVLPAWSRGFSEHDWQIVASWNPEWSLTDVLANFDSCDLFARYLVENGAGRGTYHAALFGYCFLNDVGYLDGRAEPGRLTIRTMFDAACRHLAPSFEEFSAQMRALCQTMLVRRPVVVVLDAGRVSWRCELEQAAELAALLPDLEGALAGAFGADGAESAIASGGVGSLTLAHRPPGFGLSLRLDDAAVRAANATALERLRADGDTCCYLQLDDLVVLHGLEDWSDPVLAVLWLCCRRRHGMSQPGVVERVGRLGPDHDRFVVHCPAGPDPAAIRALVSATFGPRRTLVRRF